VVRASRAAVGPLFFLSSTCKVLIVNKTDLNIVSGRYVVVVVVVVEAVVKIVVVEVVRLAVVVLTRMS
jgi:hypothetical protein